MLHYWPIAAMLVVASPLPGQDGPAGTATMHISMKLPDSTRTLAMLGPTIDMQMTFMTDGQRIAMQLVPNLAQPLMAGMQVKMVYTLGTDTIHVGILLPPTMTAAAGGGPGMRMDLPVSMLGGANSFLGSAMDSIGKKLADSIPKVAFRSLGTTATVAGLSCEEWEMVGMGDTTRICVIPTPPSLIALQQRIKTITGVQGMLDKIPGLAGLQKQAFGGREMTSIRTTSVKTGLHMELTGYAPGVPDSTAFELPPDLKPMPLPVMPPKPAGAGPAQ